MKGSIPVVACLFFMTWATATYANCVQLNSTIILAEEAFSDGKQPDEQTLKDISALIKGLNNDQILSALIFTGQGGEFGDLRNFLTQLKFTVNNGAQGQIRTHATFMTDMQNASQTIRDACILPNGEVRPTPAPAKASLSSPATKGGTTIGSRIKSLAGRDIKLFEESHNLRILAMFILGVLLTAVLAIFLHFAIIACRIVYRGRKICNVPCTLECLGSGTQGTIVMIGRLGCMFRPSEDPSERGFGILSTGTYCSLKIADQTISAKVIVFEKEVCRLWFLTPLSRTTLKEVLASSSNTPRYDFGVLRTAHRRGVSFGLGALPFQ